MSDCSYWYKVDVEYLNFAQPGEYSQIEPYGKVSVYTRGDAHDDNYEDSVVWQHSQGYTAPSVKQDKNLHDKQKCLVVQSESISNKVRVCFKGNVMEYDPSSGADEIAAAFDRCVETYPNSNPNKAYDVTFKGGDGRLKLRFTVKPCTEDCIKNNLSENNINGSC
jgi:hypothetical protein